ncbi:MAG TPA: hypothetical protein VEA38_16280 [Terriglobales bacterium]|nr:hypothetical protein [Terriglobales bacterium]
MTKGLTGRHDEGTLTETVEAFTAEVPSLTYMAVAVGAMAASVGFMVMGRKNVANFIGLWVPSILIMGLYNKLVKQHGSDGND